MAETIYDLFDEILTLIFMFLDHSTLFSCLTVSRYFYENAVRALWHTIDFDAMRTDFPTSVRRIHRCVHSDRHYPLLVRKIRCYEAISTIASFRDCQSDLADLCLKFKNLEYISIMPCLSAGVEEVFDDPPYLSLELIHSFLSLKRLKQLNLSHVLNHAVLNSTFVELYDGAQCRGLKSVSFNGLLCEPIDDVGFCDRFYDAFPNVEIVRLERPLYANERHNVGSAFLYVLQYSWWRVIAEWPSVCNLILTDVDIGLRESDFIHRSILGSNVRSLELSHLSLRSEQLERILCCLPQLSELAVIRLSSNIRGGTLTGISLVAARLEALQVIACKLGDIVEIAHQLTKVESRVKSVRLIDSLHCPATAKFVLQALQNLRGLHTFALSDRYVSTQSLKLFLDSLPSICSLTLINLNAHFSKPMLSLFRRSHHLSEVTLCHPKEPLEELFYSFFPRRFQETGQLPIIKVTRDAISMEPDIVKFYIDTYAEVAGRIQFLPDFPLVGVVEKANSMFTFHV